MTGRKKPKIPSKPGTHPPQSFQTTQPGSHSRIVAVEDSPYLDSVQLSRLEQAFRQWAQGAGRADVRLSRQRILLIFLLIRYTGARLSEVLDLDPFRDIDAQRQTVAFGRGEAVPGRPPREVLIPEKLSQEIKAALADPAFQGSLAHLFSVDPAHVRRKFYERAAACGFAKELGGPDALRKSRGVELMQNNLPLPVVQRILGHSTPNLTASFVSFSDDDMKKVTRFFLDKESRRQTSARNTFFGKISAIQPGDIQAQVEMVTLGGDRLTTLITTDSLARLGLKPGMLITAEVKAPLVVLEKAAREPSCSADNMFQGTIERVIRGAITTEYVVRIPDGTQLCSLVTRESSDRLGLGQGDPVWAMFTSFAVVLHVD